MNHLAQFIRKRSGTVLVLVAVISILAAIKLPLAYDDDVIRFLPEKDAEVEQLNAIAERFGSIHVALIGIETPGMFTHQRLEFARALAQRLRSVEDIAHVTALTELAVVDSTPGGKKSGSANDTNSGEGETAHESGSDFRQLVPYPIPTEKSELEGIRKNILSKDYLVGSLISEDASSILIVCQLHEQRDGKRVSPKLAAEAIRLAAESVDQPNDVRLHYGGAPFIAEAVANGSQDDLKRLAPYVCGIILLLILITLGSFGAAFLAILSVGLGVLWTMGLMGWLGMSLTLVSTSMPVILVALGSAYAVHLLVWHIDHDGDVEDTLNNVGWPVAIASVTTVVGFVSFLVMDIAPMREFGWQMAVGTGVCGLVSLFVIPAVLYRWPLKPQKPGAMGQRFDRALVALADVTRKRRAIVLSTAFVIAILFSFQLPKIETRMDASSFFPEGSAPLEADQFLTQHFGGSVYLQILVTGDLSSPVVLRQMANFEDRLAAVPGVTRVASITQIMSLVNEARMGQWQIPETTGMVKEFGKLATMSDPAVGLLIDSNWKGALIQVGLGGFDTDVVRDVTRRIRRLIADHFPAGVSTVARSGNVSDFVYTDAAERIVTIVEGDKPSVEVIRSQLEKGFQGDSKGLGKRVSSILTTEIVEEEMVVVKEGTDLGLLVKLVSQSLGKGELTAKQFIKLLEPYADPEELEDRDGFERGARYVYRKLEKLAQADRVTPLTSQLRQTIGPQPPAIERRISAIVADLASPTWSVPSSVAAGNASGTPVNAIVSGYPIVQEAMTRSVKRNQTLSIVTSLPLVLLVLCLVFRSFKAGLIGIVPTGVTLLVTFGLMGLFSNDLPLDIGASMLASIALGVGIDYAIHFLWRYRKEGVLDAMHTTGRSIAINAAEITAGFVVLAWASIVPMSRFGLLIAETLLVAALATLVLLPAMLDWWRPGERTK